MDFHEASLRAYEARQRLEDAQPAPKLTETYLIVTPAWEEWATNQDELQKLKDDAIKAGFTYTVQLVDED